MKINFLMTGIILLMLSMSVSAQDRDGRKEAEQVAKQSMLKAQAEKAKQDRIVEQQRQKERQAERKKETAGRNEALDNLIKDIDSGSRGTPQ